MKEKIKKKLRNTKDWLFWLCVSWTIPLMFLIVGEFLKVRIYRDFSVTVPVILTRLYYTILVAYATAKGKYKWDNPEFNKSEKKIGEVFVILWWILGLLICLIHSITGWTLPSQLPEIMITIIGIFIFDKAANRVAIFIKTKKKN